MNLKIWRVLVQILYDHKNSIEIIKPFFENLKNENINDLKFIPFLKTFSKPQLRVLYQYKIFTDENPLISQYNLNKISTNQTEINIEDIISGDKVNEFGELIQKKGIKTFNIVIKSFREIERMEIPIIQYCIMENAIECFKYLLVNGYDDPHKVRKNQSYFQYEYKWDSMATAIYFGNKEIIKILEEKGIEKGENQAHLEAAIMSYRNLIVEEIFEIMNEKEQNLDKNLLKQFILAASRSNNIKGAELLFKKRANINIEMIYYSNLIIVFLIKVIKNKLRTKN